MTRRRRWTLTDVQRALATQPKYKNVKTAYKGVRYDSKLEAQCAQVLDHLWHRPEPEILWFTRQVPFTLEGGVIYRCDFLVVRKDAPFVQVIDATGLMTQTKKNKLRQVLDRYGVTVLLYRRDGSLIPFNAA